MSSAWIPTESQLVIWLLAPYLAAFLVALLPSLSTLLVLLCCLATGLLGAKVLLSGASLQLLLLGEHGVSLSLDPLASWFLVLNGLVCLAVWLDRRQRGWDRTGWMLLLVLLGALNTSFLTTDLISLYVSLEVVGISAFLLILQGKTADANWIGLRYLLISNTAMALYLIGAALVYAQTGSFQFAALAELPLGAPLALVLVGLLTKAGVFLSGLWLPRTHAEAPPEVSALLSGVVVSAGALPLLRLEQLSSGITAVVAPLGLASAVLGLVYALSVDDAKRLLAWSTVGQMGLVVLSPEAGGVLALSHGLAKAALFLTARHWPSRSLQGWSERTLAWSVQLPLWLGSLSIAGLPPLLGYSAKKQLETAVSPTLDAVLLLLSIGSVAIYARLCRAPWRGGILQPMSWGALLLALPLLGGAVGLGTTALSATLTALLPLALGLLLHLSLEALRRAEPRALPQLDRLPDLLGGLGLVGAGLLLAFNTDRFGAGG
jgi:multicomponent Na+:H+ antiporter subunit D